MGAITPTAIPAGVQVPANEWLKRARCADGTYEPEDFFSLAESVQKRMKIVCALCPVQPQCLEWALDNELGLSINNRYGVIGGTLPIERVQLRR